MWLIKACWIDITWFAKKSVYNRRKGKGYEHNQKDEVDWCEVMDFVKILNWLDELFFIEVHGLTDKTLSE